MIAYKDSHLQEQLRIFNTLWKAQDDIWQEAARNSGLPETAFWIIYILTIENKAELTQAELMRHMVHTQTDMQLCCQKPGRQGTHFSDNTQRCREHQIFITHGKWSLIRQQIYYATDKC